MKFEDYHISQKIKQSLAEMNFRRPTDIQFKAITPILKGDDVLAIAQTGTGKTAAFAIPALELISRDHSQRKNLENIHTIVMEPTRELVIQIAEVFRSIGKYLDLTVLGLFGGVEQDPQIARLKHGVDVLVCTPGRLFDLVSQGHVDLSQIKLLVLDEADQMLDLGFINDIRQLIKHLPKYRQTLFFSATIDKDIKELAYSLVSKPVKIEISPKDPVSKHVDHYVSYIEMDDKRFFLERLLKENPEDKVLVFVRTKVRAERVKKAMERADLHCETIHGGKTQQDRNKVMADFRSGELKVLIATDVSARGVDIPNIELVVNYDLPEQAENYVHRVGRTGRGDKFGKSISFCSEGEKPMLQAIEEYITKPINELTIDKATYKETIKMTNDHTQEDLKSILAEVEAIDEFNRKKAKKVKAKNK
ncbi:MAG: DEAD/DEAH box helicase [Bacteroidales bacterium]|nr:DEAD/DEAH box helicase [Bacteroidales bacterium]